MNSSPAFLLAFKSQPIDEKIPEFYVEATSGNKLIENSGHLRLEDLESWSDDELSDCLNTLSGDKLHA